MKNLKYIFVFIIYIYSQRSYCQFKEGFENWDTVLTHPYASVLIDKYGVNNPVSGKIKGWRMSSEFGISRSTDPYAGQYALIMHNWYNYAKEEIRYHDSIHFRPTYLSGYFKYITGGGNGKSNGLGTVTLTKGAGNLKDTIGFGQFVFDSTLTYTQFVIPIQYYKSDMPDSIEIYFLNAREACRFDVVCHLLYLDQLGLVSTPLKGEISKKDVGNFWVFPNPIQSELRIENSTNNPVSFTLYNILGEVVIRKDIEQGFHILDLSSLSSQVYIYVVNTREYCIEKGKLIKQ